jgi:hypothetical protein
VFPTGVSLSWTESVDNATQLSYTLLVDGSPSVAEQIGPNTVVVRAVDTSGNASAFSNQIVFC